MFVDHFNREPLCWLSIAVRECGHTHQQCSFSPSTSPPPSTSPSPSPVPFAFPSPSIPFRCSAAAPVPLGASCCHLACHLAYHWSWKESRRTGLWWWEGLLIVGRSCRDDGGGGGRGAGCGVCEPVYRGRLSSGVEWTIEMGWRAWSGGSLLRFG